MTRWMVLSARRLKVFLAVLALLAALAPQSAQACAACYGQSDSPMALGMNWGILSLLVVILSVLGGVAAFFIFLARKSAAQPATAAVEGMLQSASEG